TLGENILSSKSNLEKCIRDGVKSGIFGLGRLENDKIELVYWNKTPSITFKDDEILIEASICKNIKRNTQEIENRKEFISKEKKINDKWHKTEMKSEIGAKSEIKKINESNSIIIQKNNILNELKLLPFIIPKGKVSDISRLLNYIQTKFENVEITINATKGEITKEEFEDNIEETLHQLGIKIKPIKK
ncbi:MAG: hypothetical protein ACTSVK_02090, partial [Promethearchaeota archaeon]